MPMSFLDRVTKAVGGAVDRGKKEVDQFVRIQKINGQIGECERKIAQCKSQIQQITLDIGTHAVEMLRGGTLIAPPLQALVDQIDGVEHQIAAEKAAIAERRADIEKIKAEDAAEKTATAAPESVSAPPPPAADADRLAAEAAPPPPATASARFCPQCGASTVGTAAFCMQCGAKLTPAV
jgi:prefoldin subunit 5